MTTWRNRVTGQASFRGVPFFVESAELAGGRRTAKHEFPLRDVPFVEDMGRQGRSFPVDGYVLGDDYLAARDSLISALEQRGPSELVHPYYGTRQVAVTSFRVRESRDAGGIASFSITFEETSKAPAFQVTPAPVELVSLAGEALAEGLRLKLAARRVIGLPVAALESVAAVVTGAARALESALAPIVETGQGLATLKRQVGELVLDAALLARQPLDVLDRFTELLEQPQIPARFGIAALLEAYGFVPSVERPPAATATRAAEQEAYDLLLALVRILALLRAAQLAPGAVYDSYDDAVATRDALTGALDEQAETADDETYSALLRLRSALVRSVPGEASGLPRLVSYTPASTVPSLVLAHRLYGDVSHEADILARNRVAHPGFIVGGAALEVLSS